MDTQSHAKGHAEQLVVIFDERDSTHGDFDKNASISQALKAALRIGGGLKDPVLAESADMICHKLARIASGGEDTEDSWLDIGGYACLAAGRLTKRREAKP